MPVLIAATMASDKPTDGYLVKDIVSIPPPPQNHSTPSDCTAVGSMRLYTCYAT